MALGSVNYQSVSPHAMIIAANFIINELGGTQTTTQLLTGCTMDGPLRTFLRAYTNNGANADLTGLNVPGIASNRIRVYQVHAVAAPLVTAGSRQVSTFLRFTTTGFEVENLWTSVGSSNGVATFELRLLQSAMR